MSRSNGSIAWAHACSVVSLVRLRPLSATGRSVARGNDLNDADQASDRHLSNPTREKSLMQQTPSLLGYIPDVHKKPTLVYDTGFLVQGCSDPDRNGWYPLTGRQQIGANLSNNLVGRLETVEGTLAAIHGEPDRLHELSLLLAHMQEIDARQVLKIREARAADRSRLADSGRSDSDDEHGAISAPASAAEDEASQSEDDELLSFFMDKPVGKWSRRYGMFDLDDPVTLKGEVRFFLFAAPLVRVGHPHYDPTYNERYAHAILGPFDGKGLPRNPRVRRLDTDRSLEFK